jgi:hypothetical protein
MKSSRLFLAASSFVLAVASLVAMKANGKKFDSFTGTIYYGLAASQFGNIPLMKACQTDVLITTSSFNMTTLTFPGSKVLKGWDDGFSEFYTLYY